MKPTIKLMLLAEEFITFDEEHRANLRKAIVEHDRSLVVHVNFADHAAGFDGSHLARVARACILAGYELRLA